MRHLPLKTPNHRLK